MEDNARYCSNETGRAVAAQMRHDDAGGLRGEQRRYLDKAVNVIWPAVQEDHRGRYAVLLRRIRCSGAGIDLLQFAE